MTTSDKVRDCKSLYSTRPDYKSARTEKRKGMKIVYYLLFLFGFCCCSDYHKERQLEDAILRLEKSAVAIDDIEFSHYHDWEIRTGQRYWQVPMDSLYYSVRLSDFGAKNIGFISYKGRFSYHDDYDLTLLNSVFDGDTLLIKNEIVDLYSVVHKITTENDLIMCNFVITPDSFVQRSYWPEFRIKLYDKKCHTDFFLWKYDRHDKRYSEKMKTMLKKNRRLTEGWIMNYKRTAEN